jgi:hypothetical protein
LSVVRLGSLTYVRAKRSERDTRACGVIILEKANQS